MVSVLVVGATRGLGASLTKQYASQSSNIVFATSRSASAPTDSSKGVTWLQNVDLMKSDVGEKIVTQLEGKKPLNVVFITAGRFTTEDFSKDTGPNWDEQTTMYTTSAIAPVFIVHQLFHAGLIAKDSKVILVSSESGSITLRHESEGGGNYGHHASKAALNMAGKLLSLDMKDAGVVVSIVHPGFMRTEMTKGVGFDKFWDEGGAVTPEEAAESLVTWAEKLDISKTGETGHPEVQVTSAPRKLLSAAVCLRLYNYLGKDPNGDTAPFSCSVACTGKRWEDISNWYFEVSKIKE